MVNNDSNQNGRPAMPAPRKAIRADALDKFVNGAPETLAPISAATPSGDADKVIVGASSHTSPLVPIVGAGDTLTVVLSLKRKRVHYSSKGKLQPFRVTENQAQLVQAVLGGTRFKSAQEIFELLFVGGVKFLAQQLAASDPAIQKLLDQEDPPETS